MEKQTAAITYVKMKVPIIYKEDDCWGHKLVIDNDPKLIYQFFGYAWQQTSGTAMYVPGAQGECRNYNQKFPKSEKQHWRHIIYGTYNPIMVTNEIHGQKIKI